MISFQQKQVDLMRQMEHRFSHGHLVATIVSFQKNYATDSQMCLSVDTFLPKYITNKIQKLLIQPLKNIEPDYYYYPSETLHITFHSVRIIHDPPYYTKKDVRKSMQLLANLTPSERPFPFIFQGVLSLPTSAALIVLVTPEYDSFIKSLRQKFVASGIPDDKTYFTNDIVFANTTFCRYTKKPSEKFLTKLRQLKDTYIGEFVANKVVLLETNAVVHPSKTKIFKTYYFSKNSLKSEPL